MADSTITEEDRQKVHAIKKDLQKDLKAFRLSHYILRPYVYALLRVYHQSIVIDGFEDIDWSKPVILAPSHQNAFMDALLIVSRTPYEPESYLYPLIRADVYDNKLLRNIVSEFHMIPVFRPRDRKNIANSNRAVFEMCEDLLAKNHNLLIHPEGNCIPHKKVRTFRKGFARIAFGAEESHNFSLDVQIIPVSINYQHITKPDGYIHLLFQKPIAVNGYKDQYMEAPAQAITSLTRDVEECVRQNNVNIEQSRDFSLADHLFDIFEPSIKDRSLTEKFTLHQKVANVLNSRDESTKKLLRKQIEQVEKLVKKLSLDKTILPAKKPTWYLLAGYMMLFLLTLPVFTFAFIHHAPLYYSFNWIVKNKVKDIQFKSSARYMLWFILLPVFYVAIGLAAGVVSGSFWVGVLYVLTTGASGMAAYKLRRYYTYWWHSAKYYLYRKTGNQHLKKLEKQIDTVRDIF